MSLDDTGSTPELQAGMGGGRSRVECPLDEDVKPG